MLRPPVGEKSKMAIYPLRRQLWREGGDDVYTASTVATQMVGLGLPMGEALGHEEGEKAEGRVELLGGGRGDPGQRRHVGMVATLGCGVKKIWAYHYFTHYEERKFKN